MNGFSLLPVFLIGLLGSVHCIGMCGGIVSAFSVASGTTRRIAIPVRQAGSGAGLRGFAGVLAYNAGRIGSYAAAGALAGGAARGVQTLAGMARVQSVGYWLANLMLVLLGLYLMGAWQGLARLETIGQILWRRIQPATKLLLPADTTLKMLALGSLWGWLPCGMVYAVLLTALLTGSAGAGALVMLAFGLGTLPMLLAMGLLGTRLRGWLQQRRVRQVSGAVVLLFGVMGLLRAWHGSSSGWLDALCLSPTMAAPCGRTSVRVPQSLRRR
jgi:sulfite exporter TauE/SafE